VIRQSTISAWRLSNRCAEAVKFANAGSGKLDRVKNGIPCERICGCNRRKDASEKVKALPSSLFDAAEEQRSAAGGAKVNSVAKSTRLRLRGDRQSLLAALASHWVGQQHGVMTSSTAAEVILAMTTLAWVACINDHLIDG
jgi:hypothetical protein